MVLITVKHLPHRWDGEFGAGASAAWTRFCWKCEWLRLPGSLNHSFIVFFLACSPFVSHSSRNPWNCFGVGRSGKCKLPLPWENGTSTNTGACHGFNESIILQVGAVMAAKLLPAGFEYLNLDCGYSTKERDSQGRLVVNTTRCVSRTAFIALVACQTSAKL